MTVRWSVSVRADLQRIRDFLSPHSPELARRASARIVSMAMSLKVAPERGHRVADQPEYREILAPFGRGAFVLRYRIDDDDILIVRVWHSREERA